MISKFDIPDLVDEILSMYSSHYIVYCGILLTLLITEIFYAYFNIILSGDNILNVNNYCFLKCIIS